MIYEFLIFLSLLIMGFITLSLFFKYISPKEIKELKSERDMLFKEVEKLIKKENYLEVIEIFEKIAKVSEKLGDATITDEFRERAENLRQQLGQGIKPSAEDLQEKMNLFIMDLIRGPFETNHALQIAQTGDIVEAKPKSLIEEGAEITARLKRIKGEDSKVTSSQIPSVTPPPPKIHPSPVPPLQKAPPPPKIHPSPVPPLQKAPSPPKIHPSPVPPLQEAPPPPKIHPPPITPLQKASPSSTPPPKFSPPPIPPPKPPSPSISLPSVKSTPITTPSMELSPIPSPEANYVATPSTKPNVIPFSDIPKQNAIEPDQLEKMKEPKAQPFEVFLGAEPEIITVEKKKKPSKEEEKAEILARLEQELPYLPEKMKKGIIKELFKRPAGKLRETWFQVYVYKNKKYASKE